MRRGLTQEVLEWLKLHPDKLYTTSHLADVFGVETKQISSSLHTIDARWHEPVERRIGTVKYLSAGVKDGPGGVGVGDGFIYPNKNNLFEQLAVLNDGELLLRCEDGKLYAARPLKVTLK